MGRKLLALDLDGTTLSDDSRMSPYTLDMLEKAKAGGVTRNVTLPARLQAPVSQGEPLGSLTVSSGDEVLAEIPILAGEEIPRITWSAMFLRLLRGAFLAE